ncbi:MAG: COQ9 family protein [Alphaproteobacteria bacterium]
MSISNTSSQIDLDFAKAQHALLNAALPHVAFDGWSHTLLTTAAQDAGLDPLWVIRLCPNGPIDLLRFWLGETDRDMVKTLETIPLQEMRIRDRITTAVRLRLERAAPHREAIRRTLATLALPQHTSLALSSLWKTVDAMWRAAGDTATDYNWYTKRALLAGVYSSTLLYWLDDRSVNDTATWAFLDRRIDEVLRLPHQIKRLKEKIQALPSVPWSPTRFARLWRKTF